MARIDFVTGAPEKYAHLVDALATVAPRLRESMAGARDMDLRREPTDGWSVHRILAHLALYAQRNGVFIHQMGTMTDPIRLDFDEEQETQRLLSLGTAALLASIEEEVARTVDFLSGTPDASWGRPGRLPRNGRRSLRQQVESHIRHFEEHIDQIRETLASK